MELRKAIEKYTPLLDCGLAFGTTWRNWRRWPFHAEPTTLDYFMAD